MAPGVSDGHVTSRDRKG